MIGLTAQSREAFAFHSIARLFSAKPSGSKLSFFPATYFDIQCLRIYDRYTVAEGSLHSIHHYVDRYARSGWPRGLDDLTIPTYPFSQSTAVRPVCTCKRENASVSART